MDAVECVANVQKVTSAPTVSVSLPTSTPGVSLLWANRHAPAAPVRIVCVRRIFSVVTLNGTCSVLRPASIAVSAWSNMSAAMTCASRVKIAAHAQVIVPVSSALPVPMVTASPVRQIVRTWCAVMTAARVPAANARPDSSARPVFAWNVIPIARTRLVAMMAAAEIAVAVRTASSALSSSASN